MKRKTLVVSSVVLSFGVISLIPSMVTAFSIDSNKKLTELSFVDMDKQHWSYESVLQAVNKGYVNGYEDGLFKPNQKVTRAEFTKMLVSSLNFSVDPSTGSQWYKPYTQVALDKGYYLTSDFSDWNAPMTRYEMSRMAVRAALGLNTTDSNKWMYLATSNGLIKGVDDTGTLAENGNTTRAQSVTIIERVLSIKDGVKLPNDIRATSRAEVAWHKTNIETMLDGVYIDVAATPEKDRFNPSLLTTEAHGGNYKGWAEGLYVIDLDDPKDPFKHLLKNAFIVEKTLADSGTHYLNNYKPLPTGGYAIISVNELEIIQNSIGLDFLISSHLETTTYFTYSNTEKMPDNKLTKNQRISFKTDQGDKEDPIGIGLTKNTKGLKLTAREGLLYPKLEGKTSSNTNVFEIVFNRFSSFGQTPKVAAKYKLPKNRVGDL